MVSGSVLKPTLSFAASHYYKYKQQFIFPGMSPQKSLLWCRVLSVPLEMGKIHPAHLPPHWGWVHGWILHEDGVLPKPDTLLLNHAF